MGAEGAKRSSGNVVLLTPRLSFCPAATTWQPTQHFCAAAGGDRGGRETEAVTATVAEAKHDYVNFGGTEGPCLPQRRQIAAALTEHAHRIWRQWYLASHGMVWGCLADGDVCSLYVCVCAVCVCCASGCPTRFGFDIWHALGAIRKLRLNEIKSAQIHNLHTNLWSTKYIHATHTCPYMYVYTHPAYRCSKLKTCAKLRKHERETGFRVGYYCKYSLPNSAKHSLVPHLYIIY